MTTAQAPGKVASREDDEDYDDKGWIFSVGGAGWLSGFQGRPGQWCTILIDSGSLVTVCGPQNVPDYPMVPSERLAFCEPSGKPLQHYGQKEVSFVTEDGQSVNIKFEVANVVLPIVSVGNLQHGGKEVVLGKKSYIKECRGRRGVRRLGLFTIAALFFLRLQIAASCAAGPSMRKTILGTKALDETWAVEGPEVPGMQDDDPEHQVDIFQSENEEMEGPEARGLPTLKEPTKAEVEWHKSWIVGRPHAILSSTEETRVSVGNAIESDEQPFRRCVPIDDRKWNDFLSDANRAVKTKNVGILNSCDSVGQPPHSVHFGRST